MGVHQQVEDQILLLDSDDAEQVLQVNRWIDIVLEVVLDSCACEHVMESEDAAGYVVAKSSWQQTRTRLCRRQRRQSSQ